MEFNGIKMSEDWAEMLRKSQEMPSYESLSGVSFQRIRYGEENFRNPVEADLQECRHCLTVKGFLHEPLCDYEECPACQWQLMSCDCEFKYLND